MKGTEDIPEARSRREVFEVLIRARWEWQGALRAVRAAVDSRRAQQHSTCFHMYTTNVGSAWDTRHVIKLTELGVPVFPSKSRNAIIE